MKSRKIWIWAIVFGLIASISLYLLLFNQPEQNNQTQKKEKENVLESEVNEEEKEEEDKSEPEGEVKSESTETQELLPIEKGKRAISIEVTEVEGVSGFIEPGDFVDVVTIMTPPPQQNGDEQQTTEENRHEAATLLLQNVRVLGIGHAVNSPEEAKKYKMVTIEVNPQEGLNLGLATKYDLYLLLRGKGDDGIDPDRTHVHEDELHEGVFR